MYLLHSIIPPTWPTTLRRWRSALTTPQPVATPAVPLVRPNLSHLAQMDPSQLPSWVQDCAVAIQYLHLLGELDWAHFPERPTNRAWPPASSSGALRGRLPGQAGRGEAHHA
jgi:hypothetical protein